MSIKPVYTHPSSMYKTTIMTVTFQRRTQPCQSDCRQNLNVYFLQEPLPLIVAYLYCIIAFIWGLLHMASGEVTITL